MIRIAILDDYQNASLEMADWSPLAGRAVITVFDAHGLYKTFYEDTVSNIRKWLDTHHAHVA